MISQMDLLMQLYMMNLLQQQQQYQQSQQQQLQQHQQQQRRTPTKQHQPQTQHKQQQNTRTLRRNNSQNTNCSSSSSSSPNSNSSPTPNLSASTIPPIQQLLLNNLQPLTQLLAPTPQPVTPVSMPISMPIPSMGMPLTLQTPPSNVLLTPTTPSNASMPKLTATTTLAASSSSLSSALLASNNMRVGDYLSNSCNNSTIPPFQLSSLYGNQFTANNFLQSSTVTSTPTEQSPPGPTQVQDISVIRDGDGAFGVVDESCGLMQQEERSLVVDDDDDDEVKRKRENVDSADSAISGIRSMDVSHQSDSGEERDDDEDNKPLSSLYSSSGVASSCVGSGSRENSSKLLLCSGVQPLESTSDSFESQSACLTPTKQAGDSSFSNTIQTTAWCRELNPLGRPCKANNFENTTLVDEEESNVTPFSLASTILTPPSSEQIASQIPVNGATTISANSSCVDTLLQNNENLKNLKKVSSYLECENQLCRQENLRDHFHCYEEPCQGKILCKKDDIVRHLKWHKKRRESLLLGFDRFTSSDDCAPNYGAECAYNGKQTHYHCVYECPKVYVSTSDVQMHANFHRRNSEIEKEGFCRYRAHENCKVEDCPFFGKKESHYHCTREGCNHTFKNKADMEKHKSYHLKDYQLTQDGFKKILKTENCPFETCKFSGVCNHIHCVRENCNYILHSSTQMISHKRKHDRQDSEQAYQKFKKEKESSEEEQPSPVPNTSSNNSIASTPLSSLSADHFLSRKRGRPPKKIQLPSDTEHQKRIKVEPSQTEQQASSAFSQSLAGLYPPFLPSFNPAAAAAAAQSMQSQDPNAPNFQLTHLMALFQLQNPLFYQNLYPGGMTGNMANILGAAAAAGGMPQNASMLGNLAAFNAAAGAAAGVVKNEFGEKAQYKE